MTTEVFQMVLFTWGISVGVWCLSLCDWENVSHSFNELAAQGGVVRPQSLELLALDTVLEAHERVTA